MSSLRFSDIPLNWTNITNAASYTVYYTDDLCEMMSLNLNNVSSAISNVSGITDINWTDSNAPDNQTRYYSVSSVRGISENLSEDIVVKHTYIFFGATASTNDNNRKNWVSMAFNRSYDAETFIQEVPDGKGIRVKRLDRPNNSSYTYITHNKGGPNNFTMSMGEGYEVEVSNNVNYTVAGDAITSALTYGLFGEPTSTNDNNRKTWIGTRQCMNNASDAETFIQGVPNNSGIRVKKLDRPNNTTYTYITHNKAGPNNFTMDLGYGYEIEVSADESYTQA